MSKVLTDFSTDRYVFESKDRLKKLATRAEPFYRSRDEYEAYMKQFSARADDRQALLFAERRHGVIAIFQGMDTAGKDGAIRHVFSGLNPLGVESAAFGIPSAEEKRRDFLWRTHAHVPPRGKIAIFNRSYYEDVLTVRVHPQFLDEEELPASVLKNIWKHRLEDIRNFEAYLVNQGYLVLKFFLHLSRDEQKNRLIARIDDQSKNWKFDPHDMEDRELWPDFMKAYEDCFRKTSTKHAPWFIVPADDKHNARLITAAIFNDALENLDLKPPEVSNSQHKLLKKLRKSL